mmetsp:Transcript_69187/g.115011  ORF Transcript_69187/g.115011 Transcript_69187/m.115011 type:complete len:356 (+) Transcript_69187:43-1110(+)|eukprot:CAMPEP_0119324586 /NCGR_PEP_ID=MMETSP1333-20130426/63662_1 /TAXON_ID=418940 /ORGANISM="Scyphosphaera apsteinii, Strain RCC1455" /LENGTH=355 /DNA_ID=CAMNT_0007332325 /DNA_START=38 /DNA_END=1105 /DNA_ORIENTATION=-
MLANGVREQVSDYYGKQLQKSEDLKTNACCTGKQMPTFIKDALAKVHTEVIAKYYGCGLCIPDELKGLTVLDLGCGAGRDCYLISQLVGESGKVVGVDMTDEQIEVAHRHEKWHAEKFGYAEPNTDFRKGVIEDLGAVGIPDGIFDVIVSNCVINLSPDKPAVLKEAFRVLKEGGEMYFSDVYASRRIPDDLRADPVLFGECLSGALYWNDFLTIAKAAGFTDPRLVEDSIITIDNKEVEAKIGHVDFFSATYRLFKLPGKLDTECEDYGQAIIYNGTIDGAPKAWSLDGHHTMETGKVFPVCGNTYHMVASTRFKPHFTFIGDFSTHYGIFDGCGKNMPFQSVKGSTGGGGGCC